MDSDDDFMSGMSSEEDNVLEDESDGDGSVDGMISSFTPLFRPP
jgi:hypothetical protein